MRGSRLSTFLRSQRNTFIRGTCRLTLLACLAKAKIIFDHTGLIADDVDHIQQGALGDTEFGGPPRDVPRVRRVYHLRFMTRFASHLAAPISACTER